MFKPLKKSFFERNTLTVARDLIGCNLIFDHPKFGYVVGMIVETEAYMSGDAACHAWHLEQKRKTNPKATGRGVELFGEPGFTYVYLNYGMYWLLNVVTDPVGVPGAVLIRAIEPKLNEDIFWRHRPKVSRREQLANGPGKLTVALGINGTHNQLDVTQGPIRFERSSAVSRRQIIATSTRIGISQARELEWRFFVADSPFVSPVRQS